MNHPYLGYFFLFICSYLSGCGTQIALSGKARSEYLKTIKPYAHYWEKPEMTMEIRQDDSWSCGTAPTLHAAEYVVFSDGAISNEQRKDEVGYQLARERLRMKWVECMKDKGYVWIKDD